MQCIVGILYLQLVVYFLYEYVLDSNFFQNKYNIWMSSLYIKGDSFRDLIFKLVQLFLMMFTWTIDWLFLFSWFFHFTVTKLTSVTILKRNDNRKSVRKTYILFIITIIVLQSRVIRAYVKRCCAMHILLDQIHPYRPRKVRPEEVVAAQERSIAKDPCQ